MNKYCCGCGVLLQCEEPYEDGYVYPTHFEETVMCRRCFRLKHYGEYKVTNKSNAFYKNIIKDFFLKIKFKIRFLVGHRKTLLFRLF